MRRSTIVVAMTLLVSMLAMAVPVVAAPQLAILQVKGMVCSA